MNKLQKHFKMQTEVNYEVVFHNNEHMSVIWKER